MSEHSEPANDVGSATVGKRRGDHQVVQARLEAAMEEVVDAMAAGQRCDREALMAKYDDVAADLAECLSSLEFVQNVAPQLAADAAAGPSDEMLSAASQRASLGDFRIVRELGRGGMGVVYEAQQLSLGRAVALKVLPFAAMLDDKQLQRFKNEARAAATLNHPNIVPVYFVGTERGVHFYAMQHIAVHEPRAGQRRAAAC